MVGLGPFMDLLTECLKDFIKAGLSSGFTILDADDQLRIIKRISKETGLDESVWPSRQSQWQINAWKDEGFRSESVDDNGDYFKENINKIYKEYEKTCLRDNLVDFGELLLRSYEVIRDNESVKAFFHSRFKSILVDEFQDTNIFNITGFLKLLQKKHQ